MNSSDVQLSQGVNMMTSYSSRSHILHVSMMTFYMMTSSSLIKMLGFICEW